MMFSLCFQNIKMLSRRNSCFTHRVKNARDAFWTRIFPDGMIAATKGKAVVK